MDYVFHILVFCSIYTILCVSLDLVVGNAGLLSLGHAALFGLGAYTSALLAVETGLSFLPGVFAGMTVAAVLSLLVSLPSLRLHGDYFMIATFGFQMILFSIFNNWMGVTRGPLGIPGIPRPIILGWEIQSNFEFVVLTGTFAVIAYVVVWRLTTSPFGRVLRSIREDELFTKSLGKNTVRFKVTVFAVSAALAAWAGSLYAHYITYIDPASFTVMESILVISMVIIGGAGSLWGPLLGAFILVTLPEALRFIGFPSPIAAHLRQMCYGSLLVIMMVFRPRGLMGRYSFGH